MNIGEKLPLVGIILSGVIICVGALTENKTQAALGIILYIINAVLFMFNGE